MQVYVSTFWTPKHGNTQQEFEDAFWVGSDGSGGGEIQIESLTVAIADGASESFLAGRWARSLVASFGTAPDAALSPAGFLAAYEAAVTGWDYELTSYLADRAVRESPVQWFEERGLGRGAYATVAALQLWGEHQGIGARWAASALGDSCIFQVRDEELALSIPISNAAEFSNSPPLLCSREIDEEAVRDRMCVRSGEWAAGDTFYVVTDALAAWFLSSVAEGGRPWEPLRDLDTVDADYDFPGWVNERRDRNEIRNDDTTLIRIDAIRED